MSSAIPADREYQPNEVIILSRLKSFQPFL